MVFRCLLVSLVASLGFELPSGQDVTSWTRSGQGWVSARIVELSALQAEASGWLGMNDPTVKRMAELAVAETTPVPVLQAAELAAPAELAFESINESMAQDFARDQVQIAAALPQAPEATPIVPESTQTIVAIIETESTANPEIESMTLVLANSLADTHADEVEEEESTVDDSTARLNSAVRLTCEAVQAWATVIQNVGDDAIPTR